jgi:hypothetical protein
MSWPSDRLTGDVASRFARIALGHVEREYPNKLDHVLDSDADALTPRAQHPIFYGSFDWHSCVHGYWTLATCLRLFPNIPEASQVRALFDRAFTAENVAAEVAYLTRPSSRGFERPYGWGWLLKLQAELMRADDPAWAQRHAPLAEAFAERFRQFLPKAAYPIRTGVHSSTSFALEMAYDYAEAIGDNALAAQFTERLLAWHMGDRDAKAWEPSLDDFLSPTLVTAAVMRRTMTPDAFRVWLDAYLPEVAEQRPAALFTPATVTDRTDGKIAHLDGLNLSRAWCWRMLEPYLDGPAGQAAQDAASAHLAAALPHVAGDYMGEHWLASFALLAMTA